MVANTHIKLNLHVQGISTSLQRQPKSIKQAKYGWASDVTPIDQPVAHVLEPKAECAVIGSSNSVSSVAQGAHLLQVLSRLHQCSHL